MNLVEFFKIVGKLKRIKRTGWVNHKVPSPESVADHSFRVSLMVMVLAPQIGADVNKAVKMALVHDIGEAKVGDVVKFQGKGFLPGYEEKIQKETRAVEEITEAIEGGEYSELFKEYAQNQTKEARLVKQVDKLERALQAQEYEEEYGINLEEFFESADILIKDENLKEILIEIEKLRNI